jgi:hypothetical protein
MQGAIGTDREQTLPQEKEQFLYHDYEYISVLSSSFLENIDAVKHSTEDSNKELHDPRHE